MVFRKISPRDGSKVTQRGSKRRIQFWGSCVESVLLVLLVVASIGPLRADEENDFDFVDKHSVDNGGEVISYGTLLDDEDLMNDEGSGPDGEHSGIEETVGTTLFPVRPVFPVTSIPGVARHDIEQYRSVINFTSIHYSSAFESSSSAEFRHHASAIKRAIEHVYEPVAGQQTATVVQFRPGSPRTGGVMATVDLDTSGFYDHIAIYRTLNNAVSRGTLGSYAVSSVGMEFQRHHVTVVDRTPPSRGDDEFCCHSGGCIDIRRKCDGHFDCSDRSDEYNCHTTTVSRGCQPLERQCGSGECIEEDRFCDGYPDCEDESDEDSSRCHRPCTAHEFRCDSGQCVDNRRICDGREDCDDGSDEDRRHCPVTCQWWQFTCASGECIDPKLLCDGRVDCRDHSDESNCTRHLTTTTRRPFQPTRPPTFRPTCRPSQFQCRDGR